MSQRPYKLISTDTAGRSSFPTSQGAVVGNLLFTSGHGPLSVGGYQFEQTTFRDQVVRTMENLKAVIEAGGSSLENCIKVEVILRRLEDFDEFNEIYSSYFNPPFPPRMTMIAGIVRPEIDVEMAAVAVVPTKDSQRS